MRTCGAKHVGDYDDNFIIKGNGSKYFEYIPKDISYTNIAHLQKILVKYLESDKIFYEYYKLSLYYDEYKQFNKNNYYTIFGKLKEDSVKEYIKKNFWKYGITDSTDVVIAQFDSPLKKEIILSPEFKNLIEDNYLSIINNEYIGKTLQLNFSQTKSLWLTLGKTQLYSPRFDKYGNFVATLVDYYDFEYLKNKHNDGIYSKLINIINNYAYQQQEVGKIRNYILVIPIVLFNFKDMS